MSFSDPVVITNSISGAVADRMFATSGKTIEAAQQSFDSGNPHAAGFAIPSATVSVKTSVLREKKTGQNIVGYLPATGAAAADKPWIALGAHYDHLGHGEAGNTLAAKDEAGRIHFGADDNASGAAAVLAIATALAGGPRGFALVPDDEAGPSEKAGRLGRRSGARSAGATAALARRGTHDFDEPAR